MKRTRLKRTRDPRNIVVVASVLLVLACAATSQALLPIQYHLTDLGTLGGKYTGGNAVNNSGQVAGMSDVSGNFEFHGFLYDGMLHDIGTLGGTFSGTDDINAAGEIVGNSDIEGNEETHAFLYDGTMHDLGTLGGTFSEAFGINDNSIAVGQSFLDDVVRHAFLYDGTMHDLGTLGGDDSFAGAINNSGVVVGSSFLADNVTNHAMLYDGTMHDLGSFNGAAGFSIAVDINEAGHVVGGSSGHGAGDHAFYYDGTMHDLGTLGGSFSSAIEINESGQIVGVSTVVGFGTSHAFLYTASQGMVDLNLLIDPQLGYELLGARGINDLGQITGQARFRGETHGYLLTPIPEPAGVALAGLSVIGLASDVRRLRRRSRGH